MIRLPMRYGLVTLLGVLAIPTATTSLSQAPSSAQAAAAQVDALFAQQIRADTPGCAVGVYRRGETVLARGYGVASVEDRRPITPRSTFQLGSLSKPFTTLAVLMLEQGGKVAMDDDVRRFVPELPNYGRPIRVRDLLQHTSGLRDFQALEVLSGRPVTTMAEFLGLVSSQRALNFDPGTTHEYSHTDYGILGLIVQRTAGVPFGEHLQSAVFDPMGMKGSFVDEVRKRSVRDRAFGHVLSPQGPSVRFPDSQTFGGDNVYSSVEDLAHWDRNFEKPVVGGATAIARMLSRPTLPHGETIPYAYGLRIGTYRGLRTVSRGGHPPGTRTEVIRFPDQHFTVATLCNSDSLEAGKLASAVADIYLGSEMKGAVAGRPQPPAAIAMSPQDLAPYAGIYRAVDDPWNLQPIEVRDGVLGEVLFDDAADESFYPMTPAGGGRFFEIGSTGNVGIFTFTSPTPAAPLRLELSWNDGPVEASERIPDAAVWRPSAAGLAEYAGVWFSPDLEATWTLEASGARLALRRRGLPDVTLRPVAHDRFLRAFGPDGEVSARLQFSRGSDRTPVSYTHLTLPTSDLV